VHFFLRQTSGLGHKVVLFRDTCRPAGRDPVMLDGTLIVANHFEQMGANRVEAIVTSNPGVGIEGFLQFETFRRPVYHGGCNRVI
jgi:hypothetical protein